MTLGPRIGLWVPALLLLNGLLAFGNLWPGVLPRPEARLSVELAVLLAVLVCLPGHWLRASRAAAVLAAPSTVWVLLHYIDVTVPALLGRPVNAFWDGQHAWAVVRMAFAVAPVRSAATVAGGLIVLALLALLLRQCWRVLLPALARGSAARRPIAALALAVLALAVGHAGSDRGRDWIAPPVAAMLADQTRLVAKALSPRSSERFASAPEFVGDVDALAGADVLLLFAEAYGAVTLDRPQIAQALAAHRDGLAAAIAASGRGVVSARVRSPTFGGASWLAHAALLSGVDTRDPDDYRLLLTTRRDTLVSHFARNGYRTVGWMPGLHSPWPEGAFYGFDRLAGLHDIGYNGPAFGFWRVPDQAAMAALHGQELDVAVHAELTAGGLQTVSRAGEGIGGRPPRFIVFPTVTTHAPFRPVAPLRDDWSGLATGAAFSEEDARRALSAPVSWTDPLPAYVDAMTYQFGWLSAWLRERAPAGMLVIVVGDHQPVAGVSGPGADWDVPVHVIASDAALLDRFVEAGFRPGLDPGDARLGPMEALTGTLLTLFRR